MGRVLDLWKHLIMSVWCIKCLIDLWKHLIMSVWSGAWWGCFVLETNQQAIGRWEMILSTLLMFWSCWHFCTHYRHWTMKSWCSYLNSIRYCVCSYIYKWYMDGMASKDMDRLAKDILGLAYWMRYQFFPEKLSVHADFYSRFFSILLNGCWKWIFLSVYVTKNCSR